MRAVVGVDGKSSSVDYVYVTDSVGRLEGQVVFGDRERPEGVSVTIRVPGPRLRGALTSATGEFRVDSIPAGHYSVEMRRIGYQGWADTLEVPPGRGVRLVAILPRSTMILCPDLLIPRGTP